MGWQAFLPTQFREAEDRRGAGTRLRTSVNKNVWIRRAGDAGWSFGVEKGGEGHVKPMLVK